MPALRQATVGLLSPEGAVSAETEVTISEQCADCTHLKGLDGETLICAAFPKGIPDNILRGLADHSRPYEGDHGLRFRPWYGASLSR